MSKTIGRDVLAKITGGRFGLKLPRIRIEWPSDRRVAEWQKVHQSGDAKLSHDYFIKDFFGNWGWPRLKIG